MALGARLSGYTWIGSRVLAADRSTQDDCVFSPPDLGGLMQFGDRVCVTDHYIAWFDYTRNDGVPFGPAFAADWDRSGALAGLWTLDPELGDFRHYRTGPNGCAWPHNELVPGSASPNQEQHWWDRYAPPTEHSIQVVSDSHRYFFSYYKAKASPNCFGDWRFGPSPHISPAFYCGRRFAAPSGVFSPRGARRTVEYASAPLAGAASCSGAV